MMEGAREKEALQSTGTDQALCPGTSDSINNSEVELDSHCLQGQMKIRVCLRLTCWTCILLTAQDFISLRNQHLDKQWGQQSKSKYMFMMKFNPEGTPAANKAEEQCKKFDLFREKLDKKGAKYGVLVQATLGHISVPFEPYPFQPTVFLSSGEDRVVTCCPLDPNFREYIYLFEFFWCLRLFPGFAPFRVHLLRKLQGRWKNQTTEQANSEFWINLLNVLQNADL